MAKLSPRYLADTASSGSSSSFSSSSSSSNVNKISHNTQKTNNNNTNTFRTQISSETEAVVNVSDSSLLADRLRANDSISRFNHSNKSNGHAVTTMLSTNDISNTGNNNSKFLHTARTTVDPLPPSMPFHNKTTAADIVAAERARIRMEFFATYDVMTGVRIAATLGGFFGLMVFLIVWKSRSSSNETLRVLKDPKIAAVAVACMQEEEDRKIQEAMVATGMSIYPDEYDTILYRRQRMLSLGNVSAPPVLHRGYRFSSVGGGGYSSLLEQPRRYSYSYGGPSSSSSVGRRKSCTESSRILSNNAMRNNIGTDDYFIEIEDELDHDEYDDFSQGEPIERRDSVKQSHGFLEVPSAIRDSRRSSAMTCCSTESSYLERRCSAITLGLAENLPESLRRKLSAVSNASSAEMWDYYYPDIQVIEPTPKVSPCPSERNFYEQRSSMNVYPILESKPPKTVKRTAARAAYPPMAAQEFTRKHSIAYYDPESAQAGRKQQIHSISADTTELFPYDQQLLNENKNNDTLKFMNNPAASAPITFPPVKLHHRYESTTPKIADEIRLNVQRTNYAQGLQTPTAPSGLNSFTCSNSPANTTTIVSTTVGGAGPSGDIGTSSLSIDSSAAAIPSLSGKRAPLASLSSFKISSLECQDSEMRSLDGDSVFLDSVADTDEDMEQFSTDSEDISSGATGDKLTKQDTLSSTFSNDLKIVKSIPLPHPDVQRLSSSAQPSRPRRPVLERHRTISASSSDCISLIGNQLKDFPLNNYLNEDGKFQQNQQQTFHGNSPPETFFGGHNQRVDNLSPHPYLAKRPPLQQQISDQSLPTTTEDDTCSTLNTEVLAATRSALVTNNTIFNPAGGSSSVLLSSQHQSDSRNESSFSSDCLSVHAKESFAKRKTKAKNERCFFRRKLSSDPTRSSISDSVTIGVRQPLICVPSSLKNLIRGSASGAPTSLTAITTSKSATNLSLIDDEHSPQCGSVVLELPLIKLPEDETSDTEVSESQSKSDDDSGDLSLPSTSRKWSRETLF